ncbi:MAG TPA: nucleoside phosphorylase [Bacilli bacterium]
MSTLYMKLRKEDVSPYVLFSGDPWRVEVLKQYLEDVKHIAFSREYNTYTGKYKGVLMTITSTGIGSPSAAIAMEEMYEVGMRVALRVGTVMGLKDDLLGKYIVPIASIRGEGTSHTYVEAGYPAVSDFELVRTINEVVADFGGKVDNGLNLTLDGFYSQMRESRLSKELATDISATFSKARKLNISGIDMESACLLVLGRLMNVKTAILTLVTVLENLKGEMSGEARKKGEEELCRIALESLYRYSQKEMQK